LQSWRCGDDEGSLARVSGMAHSASTFTANRTRSWENRSSEWARFISVLLGAEKIAVEVEGNDGEMRTLPDCFGV